MNQLEEGQLLDLQFEKRQGLLPVVVQDAESLQILMLGYANREALSLTLSSGKATFFSTSRQSLWTKGETSGNALLMVRILVDCDQDALVYQVRQEGDGCCHTKSEGVHRSSCFYREVDKERLRFV